jgi:hypothetical protein
MKKNFTSSICVELTAASKKNATDLLWKAINGLIDNETILSATILYTDEDFEEPGEPAFRSWYGYDNYPGRPI